MMAQMWKVIGTHVDMKALKDLPQPFHANLPVYHLMSVTMKQIIEGCTPVTCALLPSFVVHRVVFLKAGPSIRMLHDSQCYAFVG